MLAPQNRSRAGYTSNARKRHCRDIRLHRTAAALHSQTSDALIIDLAVHGVLQNSSRSLRNLSQDTTQARVLLATLSSTRVEYEHRREMLIAQIVNVDLRTLRNWLRR